MRNHQHLIGEPMSVLRELRAFTPRRRGGFTKALRVAEAQADRLLELTRVEVPPFPIEVVGMIPRIDVSYRDIPASGLSYWTGRTWVICINRREPRTRKRFTALHELKHIIDHGAVERLYPARAGHTSEQQAEQVADYFAGCVLMPRRFLESAWGDGVHDPAKLARRFATTIPAINVRLAQVGLSDGSCGESKRSTMSYERAARPLAPSKEDFCGVAC